MYEYLLPIGTVVLLKGANKKLMIAGIKPVDQAKPDQVYDYFGVTYPEGYLSREFTFLFNHEDINDVIFTGYQNPERETFIAFLENAQRQKEQQTAE